MILLGRLKLGRQLTLQELASRSFWDLIDQVNSFGTLIIGEPSTTEVGDLFVSNRGVLLKHNKRSDLFSIELVRYADSRCCNNRRVLVKHFINLTRIDILAAANDHVRLAIDNVVETVSITIANISRVKPSVAKGCGSCYRVFVVTLQYVFTSQYNLSERSVDHFPVLFIHHSHFISNWHATRTCAPTFIRGIESRAAGRL